MMAFKPMGERGPTVLRDTMGISTEALQRMSVAVYGGMKQGGFAGAEGKEVFASTIIGPYIPVSEVPPGANGIHPLLEFQVPSSDHAYSLSSKALSARSGQRAITQPQVVSDGIVLLGDAAPMLLSPGTQPSDMTPEEEKEWEHGVHDEVYDRKVARNKKRLEEEAKAVAEEIRIAQEARRAKLTAEERAAEDAYWKKLAAAWEARLKAEKRCEEDYNAAMKTANDAWWSDVRACWTNFGICVVANEAVRGGPRYTRILCSGG